jgi:hypothetical protein
MPRRNDRGRDPGVQQRKQAKQAKRLKPARPLDTRRTFRRAA